MNVDRLWRTRFQDFAKERIHYLTRIVNGFAIIPIVLFILGSYYYPLFLEWLPPTFPVVLIFALLFGILTTFGEHRTLLKEADLVFLPHVETKLSSYLSKSYIYSWLIQSFFIILVILVLSPLYVDRLSNQSMKLFVFIGILLLMKAWNLKSSWQALRLQDHRIQFFHTLLRLLVNLFFIYGLLNRNYFLMIFAAVVASFITFYDFRFKKEKTLNWLGLVQREEKLDIRFFKWISLFVDIPHLLGDVRYRRILPQLTRILPYNREQSYRYLYLKLFFRSQLFDQVIRLTILEGIILFFIPNRYALLTVYLLFLLMVGFQLRSFWSTFTYQFWVGLYPIPREKQKEVFISTTFLLMVVQGIIAFLPRLFLLNGQFILLLLPVIGTILAYLYSFVLLKKRITL